MSWLLRLFSLETLLRAAGELALGERLWNLVRDAVEAAERSLPNASGEEKFKAAFQAITLMASGAAIEWRRGLVNLGIELAVRLLRRRSGEAG